MADRQDRRGMWAELTREAGMLAVVFGILDSCPPLQHLTLWQGIIVIAAGILSIIGGVEAEARRK